MLSPSETIRQRLAALREPTRALLAGETVPEPGDALEGELLKRDRWTTPPRTWTTGRERSTPHPGEREPVTDDDGDPLVGDFMDAGPLDHTASDLEDDAWH